MIRRLDPIVTSSGIVSTYTRYLLSLLPLRDEQLARALPEALATPGAIARGPLLEMTPPFRIGKTLNDLVDEGVLNEEMRGVFSDALPGSRPLYRHQERAIRRAIDGRNLVIATGTGSGKTESFLVPILNHLVGEESQETSDPEFEHCCSIP